MIGNCMQTLKMRHVQPESDFGLILLLFRLGTFDVEGEATSWCSGVRLTLNLQGINADNLPTTKESRSFVTQETQ